MTIHESSYEAVDYGAPESFFVFLVGHCKEWPENRVEQGDIALYNEYVGAGVPPDQILYIKDKKASKKNCEQQLSQFLKTTRPHSTLVFYYGGHGKPTGFCTHQAEWRFQDVTNMIERSFQGERVLFLLDCCASGNLAGCLRSPHTVTKHYVCLASSPAFVTTTDEGEEWILNYRWILAMRCSDGNLPLSRVIEYLSDRAALILGDQFTTYVSAGVDCTKGDWMPRRQRQDLSELIEWDRLEDHIPEDARVSAKWSIGDSVFYKHPGGGFKPSSEYIPPGWLTASILAENEDELVQLEVYYPERNLKWNVQTPRRQLMNNFYMGQMWMLPDKFEKAQCVLAQSMKYLDYAIEANTMLKVSDKNGDTYLATVLDWRLFDWRAYLNSRECNNEPPFGAHVPIRLLDKNETRLIPIQSIRSPNITVQPFLDSWESIKGNEMEWARKALLRSIESSGKSVCHAGEKIVGKMTAFRPEDEEWYDVEPMNPNTLSLKILATHAKFTLTGVYCPLAYEDGEFHLAPLFYIQELNVSPWSS